MTHGSRRVRRLGLAVVVGLALTTTSCGGEDAGAAGAQECCAAPADTLDEVDGVEAAHNSFDVAFLNWMSPHDGAEQQLTELVATRTTSRGTAELSEGLTSARESRVQAMQDMARAWGEPPPPLDPDALGDVHRHDDAPGEARKDTEVLRPLSGPTFDQAFLRLMVEHHLSALPEAQRTISEGLNPQAKALAQQVVAEQTAQIGRMQQMIGAG